MHLAPANPPLLRGPGLISRLPNELLLQIFEAIPADYDEQCRVFSAIARVSHQFYRLITPLLYRSFEDCCPKHVHSFAYTLFAREDRALLVKHFKGRKRHDFDVVKRAGCSESWDTPAVDPELVLSAGKQVSSLSEQDVSLPLIAFSLSCICLNIQWLDVTDGIQYLLTRLHSETSGNVLRPSTAFHQVHILSITLDLDRSFELRSISLLFNLPRLRGLTIRKGAMTLREEQLFAQPSFSETWQCNWQDSTVEELTFEESCLPVEWIEAAVMSCKTLKHFQHEYYYWSNHKNVYPRLFHALAKHQESLVYLRINELNGCKMYSEDQLEPDEPVSFANYESLTYLDIPLFFLSIKTSRRLVQDILPSTLQVFNIDVRSAREGFSDLFFISLAWATHAYLPSLRSVEVICRIEEYSRNGYIPMHFSQLRKMFASHGVRFMYHLEFVSCEFKAAYMEPLLKTLRGSGTEGSELAAHSSLEEGCLGLCDNRSPDARQSRHQWGYLQPWPGPSEFELV
ncbi:hypothetical protein BKA66DRAFT_212068 [Pyrenochaeta sp. MPI-SDFR-AT-0127]|nr:hypothetical protein BKA66DRAFT_212068 [Pyrenochaeta sp. MPI-SDFR-AT-0127]